MANYKLRLQRFAYTRKQHKYSLLKSHSHAADNRMRFNFNFNYKFGLDK